MTSIGNDEAGRQANDASDEGPAIVGQACAITMRHGPRPGDWRTLFWSGFFAVKPGTCRVNKGLMGDSCRRRNIQFAKLPPRELMPPADPVESMKNSVLL